MVSKIKKMHPALKVMVGIFTSLMVGVVAGMCGYFFMQSRRAEANTIKLYSVEKSIEEIKVRNTDRDREWASSRVERKELCTKVNVIYWYMIKWGEENGVKPPPIDVLE